MNLRVDLREVRPAELSAAVATFSASTSFLVTAWQWSAWKPAQYRHQLSPRLMVMVPDFLYYARLISTGQAAHIIKLPSSTRSLIQSAIACVPAGIAGFPGLARGHFWSGAEALLTYDLGLLEKSFKGEVLLHYNLSDFAWLFEKQNFLQSFKAKTSQRAGWGIATQQCGAALSCCSRWDTVPTRLLYTPGRTRPEGLMIKTAKRHQFGNTRFTLDLTQWPHEILSGPDIKDLQREADDEYLVSVKAALQISNHSLL